MIPAEVRVARVIEKRVGLRTRTFGLYAVEEVLAILRAERFNGRMIVDLAQGGVCTVQAEDRTPLPYLHPSNNSV